MADFGLSCPADSACDEETEETDHHDPDEAESAVRERMGFFGSWLQGEKYAVNRWPMRGGVGSGRGGSGRVGRFLFWVGVGCRSP